MTLLAAVFKNGLLLLLIVAVAVVVTVDDVVAILLTPGDRGGGTADCGVSDPGTGLGAGVAE